MITAERELEEQLVAKLRDLKYVHRPDIRDRATPAVQIELKTLGLSPRRAMQQIVEYKNDPGNRYTRTLCFVQETSRCMYRSNDKSSPSTRGRT